MSSTDPASAQAPFSRPYPLTTAGIATMRRALGRLSTLISLGLAVSVLVFAESFLSWAGTFGTIDRIGAGPFSVDWVTGVEIAVAVALAVAIAVLIVLMIVNAIVGLIAWRRGVRSVVEGAPELGTAHVLAVARAREDGSTTLWLFLLFVLAAIVVSATFAGLNQALGFSHVATLPAVVGSVLTGLASSGVLVGIYYYGGRHVTGLLRAVASPTELSRFATGRSRMFWGAVVGLGAAFSSWFWPLGVFAIASLAVILPGVLEIRGAYDLWLSGERAAPGPTRADRPAVL